MVSLTNQHSSDEGPLLVYRDTVICSAGCEETHNQHSFFQIACQEKKIEEFRKRRQQKLCGN